MAHRSDDALSGVPVTVPPDFDVDDGSCVVCGGQLDTGWECNECGADHMPAVKALLRRRREIAHDHP